MVSLLLKAGWFLLVRHLDVPARPYFEGHISELQKSYMIFNIYSAFSITRNNFF